MTRTRSALLTCSTLAAAATAAALITPPAVAEKMQQAIPSARLAVIHGAGHMTCMEQPEQVNRAIRDFLLGIS